MKLSWGIGALVLAVCSVHTLANDEPLVSQPGDKANIPGWHLISATSVSDDMFALSRPGVNTEDWHRVGPRKSVMAGLIESGVYNDTKIFYSDNMKELEDDDLFRAPWLYREEFTVNPSEGQYFTLITHGITSKADIYLNGVQIATSEEQQGSYGGHSYNIRNHVQAGKNCVLIRAYPTNYLRDFAMGFVDWNPYPADNGTGVWRDVEIAQTGAVSMSPFRVITDFTQPHERNNVNVILKTDLINHSPNPLHVSVNGTIWPPTSDPIPFGQSFYLRPGQELTAFIKVRIDDARIWWPASWGDQPLYEVQAKTYVTDNFSISDAAKSFQFGIRSVGSRLNQHNDTAFFVNGFPFQVLGAGYGPDMFMRFDEQRVRNIFRYMLDMGMNTVRLEGKQEHPELYSLADEMGMMVLPGWECCDKWEGWEYNEDADGLKWSEKDYTTAQTAMRHEAEMMQPHPSILGFLVGSDYWPDKHATGVYLNALMQMDWRSPVIASAAMRGFPDALGPSGMKMDGPYDWVPPNYWYTDKYGAAFGFGTELGAGVGTPEMGSLKRFLSDGDLQTLWTKPEEGLYHMSREQSSFYNRKIYNEALTARYGEAENSEDYVEKCQMADYEATRAQFEAYSTRQNASRPATGAIYWMLNSAWPNLHWQLFDYYLAPMAAYFGTKVGTRVEHVAYDYEDQSVWLINHSLEEEGERQVQIDLITLAGQKISSKKVKTTTSPSSSKRLGTVPGIDKMKAHDIAFLRLVLHDKKSKKDISRNVYWLTPKTDTLDWNKTNFFYTPVTEYVDYKKLNCLAPAKVKATLKNPKNIRPREGWIIKEIELQNKSKGPALFLHLSALNANGENITPVYWSDNYVTLWPREKVYLTVAFEGNMKGATIEVSGRNVKKMELKDKKGKRSTDSEGLWRRKKASKAVPKYCSG
ncbi:hypothetical protein N7532_001076 [Penicillium argentinense]|uniref:Exo-1,4-beta-D-glucosaminidase n=1 Tax=Penicillium argentinense TaxID=1131581 RepID=A0A9W9G211_9EURO|nr:uncharacterized protein N7532_001076 [Penicillium argentinense]KAJ5110541.1 hypothetical protein N7532_001076 [Penicillium argentinense]